MTTPVYSIDVFAPFFGHLVLQGWVDAPVGSRLELRFREKIWPIQSYGLASPDVAADRHGADYVRFDERMDIGECGPMIHRAKLAVILPDATSYEFGDLASVLDPARQVQSDFVAAVAAREAGRFLELGSRARSGLVNSSMVPPMWTYVGMDILEGTNVDVVGDAHELSSLFPPDHFDAVMSLSVVEHLLMPWKVVIELNRVMKVGAVGLFTTHQAWPVHDAPWDFWRFSKESWAALFNPITGFEIVKAEVGEPGYVVPQRCHAVTNFGQQPVFLSSVVMFRKTRNTTLRWDVSLPDLVESNYPAGEASVEL
ncbi:class I SAM-dependent methyltransferase [Brevundimonas sp. SL161]|uniref:class I SAM-dependent methyltransferase n=1 Tax=Brevundimonas sp. SL161 TaxID=2804613 RepID=UPI003CE79C34